MNRLPPPNNQRFPPPMATQQQHQQQQQQQQQQQHQGNWRGRAGGRGPPAPFFRGGAGGFPPAPGGAVVGGRPGIQMPQGHAQQQQPPQPQQQGTPPPMMPPNGRGGGAPPLQHLPPLNNTNFRGGGGGMTQQPPRYGGGGRGPPNHGRMVMGPGRPPDMGGRGPFMGGSPPPGAARGGGGVGGGSGGRSNGALGHAPSSFMGPRPPFHRGQGGPPDGRGGRGNFRGMQPPLNHRFPPPNGAGPPLSHQQPHQQHQLHHQVVLPPPPPPPAGLMGNNNPMFRGGPGRGPIRGGGFGPRIPQQPPLSHPHLSRPPFAQPPPVGMPAMPPSFPPPYPGSVPPASATTNNAATHPPPNLQFVQPNNLRQYLNRPIGSPGSVSAITNASNAYHQGLPADSTLNNYNAVSTPVKPTPVERPWTEYIDSTTGKTYYSNGVTSQWTKPQSMVEAEQLTPKRGKQDGEDDADSEPPRKMRKKNGENIPEFASKESALEAFKKLLADRDVTPAQKWGEVVKLFSGSGESPIWEGCQKALTTGERKQALAEYQTKLANDLRAKERQERQRSKEAYLKLLSEILPTVSSRHAASGSNKSYLSFQDVQGLLQKDDRYHAIENDATREALFVEFWEEYRKREERKKLHEKREEEDRFLDMLKELNEEGILTCAASSTSNWDSFVVSLESSVRAKYSRFMASSSPSDTSTTTSATTTTCLDRQERDFLFGRFLDDLQQAEEENHRRSQEDRRQIEMDQREFFMETLVRLARDGYILPNSSYSSVVDSVLSEESSFVELHQHDRDRPRELFEDFVNDWNELYRGDRLFLSDIVRRAYEKMGRNIVSDNDESYEAFCQALLDEASGSANTHQRVYRIISEKSPVSSAQLYFNEMRQSRKSVQSQPQRGTEEDSSEDEGEIAEEETATQEV
ncbi:hypothetical protein ACA910_015845 [Epithemia clementina (nom. ined.)]